MIFNFTGSGLPLDLEVIGGTTQPAQPAENTVWLNTSIEIGEVYLQENQPSDPAAGDVWIDTSAEGTTLEVMQSPYLEIEIGTVKQYNGTAWSAPDVQVYKAGEWHASVLYLYSAGAWSEYGIFEAGSLVTVAETSYSGLECVKVQLTDSGANGYARIASPIDVTKYNTLSVEAKTTSTSTGSDTTNQYAKVVGLNSTNTPAGSGYPTTTLAAYVKVTQGAEKTVYTTDISSLSGDYYLLTVMRTQLSSKNGLYLFEIALMV